MRLAVLPIHQVAGVAEERGVLEEIRALLAAQPDVDLFQVALAVVAGNAGEIDAEERLAVEDGQLVIGIELLHHAQIVAVVRLRLALHVLARDDVGRGRDVIALRRRRDDGARHVVIRPVDAQVLLHPVMEEVLPAAHFAVGAEQVHEEVGPLVDVGLARQQLVDRPCRAWPDRYRRRTPSISCGEGMRPVRSSDDAAQEFVVRGQRRVRDAVALHLAENLLVDEIALRAPAPMLSSRREGKPATRSVRAPASCDFGGWNSGA